MHLRTAIGKSTEKHAFYFLTGPGVRTWDRTRAERFYTDKPTNDYSSYGSNFISWEFGFRFSQRISHHFWFHLTALVETPIRFDLHDDHQYMIPHPDPYIIAKSSALLIANVGVAYRF